MRRELFPRLVSAYEIWKISGRRHDLEKLLEIAATHREALGKRLIGLYREQGASCEKQLVSMIETHTL